MVMKDLMIYILFRVHLERERGNNVKTYIHKEFFCHRKYNFFLRIFSFSLLFNYSSINRKQTFGEKGWDCVGFFKEGANISIFLWHKPKKMVFLPSYEDIPKQE